MRFSSGRRAVLLPALLFAIAAVAPVLDPLWRALKSRGASSGPTPDPGAGPG